MPNDHATQFGRHRVTEDEKTEKVRSVFDSVASRYDLMNDLMSGGIHRLWKRDLIRAINPAPGQHLLDVAGGTGDIAFRYLDATQTFTPPAHVTVCDINSTMLQQGQRRAIDRGLLSRIDWVTGDASALPLPDNSVDAYTISFGLRNVTHIDKALEEARRVLRPGGKFLCLEFSKPASFLQKAYAPYLQKIVPWMGDKVAKDHDSYEYLAESIELFLSQEELLKKMTEAGLEKARYRNFTGGICALHMSFAP